MKKRAVQSYTNEFREEAIRYVIETDITVSRAARELGIPSSTLATWLKRYQKDGVIKNKQRKKPLSDKDAELSALKKELSMVKMERDILKKAAAYFAKESL